MKVPDTNDRFDKHMRALETPKDIGIFSCTPANENTNPSGSFCYLQMHEGRTAVGTGTLIGRRLVLTAGHNLGESGVYVNHVNVSPAYHYRFSPPDRRGTQTVSSADLRVHDGYLNGGHTAYDIGVIILPDETFYQQYPYPRRVRAVTPQNFPGRVYGTGYPGGAQNLGHPWMSSGNVDHFNGNVVHVRDFYGAAGSSGTAFDAPGDNPDVIGVLVAGAGGTGASCYFAGPIMTQELVDWIFSHGVQ